MSVTGAADGDPVKCGVPISDFATGLYAAFAVAALARRVEAGGKGGYIDISMLGASLAVAALQTSEYFGSGRDPRRLGAAHPRNAPYQAFRAKDGDFVMAAGNNRLWRSVCEIVGRPDLVEDPRFLSTTDRAANQGGLEAILNGIFVGNTVGYWLDRFEKAGVPCGRINRYSEALADPQVAHMGWVSEIELPGGQTTRTFASPLRIDGEALPIYRTPPALGADRECIISDLSAEARRRA
jgi:crotonobetainyl-CoA:carnitine CoA-transferase CaiB-like acyl-CoA transferase